MKQAPPVDDPEALLDELADVLQQLAETSCLEMIPLWLAGTRLVRRDLPGEIRTELEFEPSPNYMNLSRGTQNRYRQLACWRHSLLWRKILDRVDPDFAKATRAIYFTPYPKNLPPYAWSQKVSNAPDASSFPSPATLKSHAKEGCWQSVQFLRQHIHKLNNKTLKDELIRGFLKTGCRDTLRDVLKLDDHFDNWTTL